MSKHHPYFYPIEKQRLTAFQALWDNVKDGVHVQTAFARLKRNLTIAGELRLPQERQVRAWARDVIAGLIDRPSAIGEDLPTDFTPTASTAPSAVASIPKKKVVKKAAPIDKSAYEPVAVPSVEQVQARIEISLPDISSPEAIYDLTTNATNAIVSDADALPFINLRPGAPVEEDDPVKEAVDIIVTHYQDKAFAKARRDAAAEAARALRHFADKVEASA
jgi:hypothetical protein